MTEERGEQDGAPARSDDVRLDPALAAQLRLAEAELRQRMNDGIWTGARIGRLVAAVVILLLMVGGLWLFMKLRG